MTQVKNTGEQTAVKQVSKEKELNRDAFTILSSYNFLGLAKVIDCKHGKQTIVITIPFGTEGLEMFKEITKND